ncbi:MAG: hypothetical protein AAGI72_15460 [Pseudomonadota bacterium]
MAAGDVDNPQQFYADIQQALHDLELGTYKFAFVTSAITPAANDPDPRWGAGGSTDYSTAEVTPGGNYAAGGVTLLNPTVTLVSGRGRTDFGDVDIVQDAANPNNARWAIVYNDDANKRVTHIIDLGSNIDLTSGPFAWSWNTSGAHEIGAAA